MANHIINHEGQTISYVLQRKNVKNVNLKVRPDSTVIVTASKKVPDVYVEQVVRKKAPWIIKNIRHFDQKRRLKEKQEYMDGEIIYYLGQQYRLKVLPAENGEAVNIKQNEICFFMKDTSDFYRKEKLFNRWVKEQAQLVFHQSLDKMHAQFYRYHVLKKPMITIRTMKTRWGSCSWNKQKITLNTKLIHGPRDCIDYVVLHELTHFIHRKHDAQFYDILALIMPEWKERRQILKNSNNNGMFV